MRLFRLSPRAYLERFEAEALLLVADRNRLLTVNVAAAELLTEASRTFGVSPFTVQQGGDWLAGVYQLDARDCRAKVRELLAFALRQGLVCRDGAGR